MSRLTRNELEEGTQSEKRRAAKNKLKSASQRPTPGRQAAAKKSLPLRRGQGYSH
ncbi:hypothetical protein GCM10027589_42560 [Actinocorallia lasiicapitis]